MFPPVFITDFHSDLVSECLAVGPAELVVVTLGNAVLVCLYFVVCTLLGRIPQIQWWHQCRWPQRGHRGPRCPIGWEPERLGQHMAPRVSTSPAVIPQRLCRLSICRSLLQNYLCFFYCHLLIVSTVGASPHTSVYVKHSNIFMYSVLVQLVLLPRFEVFVVPHYKTAFFLTYFLWFVAFGFMCPHFTHPPPSVARSDWHQTAQKEP